MFVNSASDKLIILNFPPYAGGKFLANCLALSKHAVVQDRFIADFDCRLNSIADFNAMQDEWRHSLLNVYDFVCNFGWEKYCQYQNENIDALEYVKKLTHTEDPFKDYFKTKLEYILSCFPFMDYYDFKLKMVMSTIPKERIEAKNWDKYELGCYQLSGTLGISEIDYASNFSTQMVNITNSDKNFFLVDHSPGARFLLEKWPNAKVLRLVNYTTFQVLAAEIKGGTSRGTPWIDDNSSCDYTFDVDANYFHEDSFLKEVSSLYDQLKYDDFNEGLIQQFYREYIKIHTA